MQLRDVRNIIIPQNNKLNIDRLFENIIIRHNCDSNNSSSYELNHILCDNKNNIDFKNNITAIVIRHVITFMEIHREQHRDRYKIGKLNINIINDFIVRVNQIINNLITVLKHLYDVNDNIKLIQNIIRNMIDIIFVDLSFKNCIMYFLQSNVNIKPFHKLFSYLEDCYYIVNILPNNSQENGGKINNIIKTINNNYYRKFVYCDTYDYILKSDAFENNILFEIVNEYIYNNYSKKIINDTGNTYAHIYEFKNTVDYLKKCINRFKFMTFNNTTYHSNECNSSIFNKIQNDIITQFTEILTNNNIFIIQQFFIECNDEINYIITTIKNIHTIMMNHTPEDINYCVIYSTILYKMSYRTANAQLIECVIKNYAKKIFNTSDKIKTLVETIHNKICDTYFGKINFSSHYEYYYIGSCIDNVDYFIALLTQKLIERYIYLKVSPPYTFEIIERNYYDGLIKIFNNNHKLLYRYNVVWNDIKNTIMLNENSIVITSPHVWKVNYKMGNMYNSGNGFYSNIINVIHMKYKNNNKNKHLIFYPHMGIIDATVNNGNITMLPLHMFVLEQFIAPETKLQKSEIELSFLNYCSDIKNKIIDSLVIGNVLLFTNGHYYANSNINNVNLIDIFYNIIKENIVNNTLTDIVHDRIDIIKANINSVLKKSKQTEHELFNKVKNNIKIFNMSYELFMQACKNMTDSDYIIMDGKDIVKIVY